MQMLQRYFGYTRLLADGAPAPNATVTVYHPSGTLTLATLHADAAGTPKSNPFTADDDGFFFFYVPRGDYDVRFSGGGIVAPYTWGDVAIDASPDNLLFLSDFESLADAIAAIDTAEQTLVINVTGAVDVDTTIPANISLWCVNPGKFQIASGKTLTIAGPLTAPPYQIFDGAGTVTSLSGVNTAVYPEWWGAVGDGSTPDDDAFAAMTALANASGQIIKLGVKSYYLASTWDLTDFSGGTIQGEGPLRSVIKSGTTTTPGLNLSKANASRCFINDINLQTAFAGGGAPTYDAGNNAIEIDLLQPDDISGLQISRCSIYGFAGNGIYIAVGTGPVVIEDTYITQCGNYGIYLGVTTDSSTPSANVTVSRGAIQNIPGGIYSRSIAPAVIGTDIELGAAGLYPAVFLDGHATVGNSAPATISGVTMSTGANLTPPGLLAVWNSPGAVVTACNSQCNVSGTHNVYVQSSDGYVNLNLIGGLFTGSGATSGYPVYLDNTSGFGTGEGIEVAVMAVTANNYQTGKRTVYATTATANARVTTIGFASNTIPSSTSNPLLTDDMNALHVGLVEGVATPSTVSGLGRMFIDVADGLLKVKLGSGTVKTITWT